MSEILLAKSTLVGSAFSDAGMVLFGILILLFGSILTISLLTKSKPELISTLVCLLSIEFLLLLGIVCLDLTGVQTLSALGPFADLSELLSTHRWLIIQAPFLLLASALVSLVTYGKEIVERHAHAYFRLTMISIWLSFLLIVLIGFESML